MSDNARTTQEADAPSVLAPKKAQTFYRYTDKSGKLVIVDSFDKLPTSARARAEPVELQEGPSAVERGLFTARQATSDWGFNLPSFALGVGVAVLLIGVAMLLKRSGSLVIAKLLGVAAVVALLAGLYLGLLRRSTGQSDAVLASPSDIIDDAKSTIEQANESRRRQEQLLDEIGKEGK